VRVIAKQVLYKFVLVFKPSFSFSLFYRDIGTAVEVFASEEDC